MVVHREDIATISIPLVGLVAICCKLMAAESVPLVQKMKRFPCRNKGIKARTLNDQSI